MTCPTLEDWLEALDEAGSSPPTAHADCATCRDNEAAARELLRMVRAAAPSLRQEDERFTAAVVRDARVSRRVVSIVVASIAMAAGVALWARSCATAPDRDDLAARGEASSAAACSVSEVTEHGERTLHDGDHVPSGAQLMFRVRNPLPEPRWVGVFAIDRGARVGWYHPAYETAGDPIETLGLPARSGSRILGGSVSLPLEKGPARVICWVSAHPSRVSESDEVVERTASGVAHPTELTRVPELGGEQEGWLLWFDEQP